MANEVIAEKTEIVHDDQLNIDRQVIAGQPVPPELVEAYRRKAAGSDGADSGEEKPGPQGADSGEEKPVVAPGRPRGGNAGGESK